MDWFEGVLKVAAGIVIGGFVLWIGISRYEAYHVNVAVQQLADDLQSQAQADAERRRKAEADRWAYAIFKQREQDAESRLQRQQQRADDLQRKQYELEFKVFYKPAPDCDSTASGDPVKCGNDYMRAKAEFHKQWVSRYP